MSEMLEKLLPEFPELAGFDAARLEQLRQRLDDGSPSLIYILRIDRDAGGQKVVYNRPTKTLLVTKGAEGPTVLCQQEFPGMQPDAFLEMVHDDLAEELSNGSVRIEELNKFLNPR